VKKLFDRIEQQAKQSIDRLVRLNSQVLTIDNRRSDLTIIHYEDLKSK